jgi:UDP-N-acetylmuramoyl-tripeptide--D-alanyl-D-alanine ligase
MRGELLEVNGVGILNDCYNSNPRALGLMLETLARAPARGRRIAVLGEMLELGPASDKLHRQAGRQAAAAADHVVGVRGHARFLVEGATAAGLDRGRLAFFGSAAEAGDYVASLVQPGDLVLFKGSRGVRLEDALSKLMPD